MCNTNCSKPNALRTYMIVFLAVAIALTSMNVSVYAAPGASLSDKVQESIGGSTEEEDEFILSSETYYPDYIAQKDSEGFTDYKGEDVDVSLGTAKLPDGFNASDYLKDKYLAEELNEEYSGEFFVWDNSDVRWVEFSVDIKEKGYYNIEIEYYTPTGSVQTPQRSLNIDGQLLFTESVTVDFSRLWKDSTPVDKEHMILNSIGDQVRPKQEQVFGLRTMRINDHDGKYNNPLKYALDEGSHTIKFLYQYEDIVIKSIKLVAPEEIPTYEEKLAEWKSNGAKEATGTIRIEGEAVTYKSDSSLRVDASSDPVAYPSYENGSTRLNVIGGSTWAASNQTLTWRFKVEESGLYKIVLRAYAKYTDGIPVYRQVKINGEVPFKEFECYEIAFDDWNCFALEDGGEALLVYLDADREYNELQLTVKLGEIAEIMNALEVDANRLSSLVKDITKITSTNPDPNFEYNLEDKIPNLVERFQQISDSFGEQIDRISGLSSKRPSAVNNFIMMQEQIDRMIANTEIIAKNYSSLTDAMTNLSTWIKNFASLPMQIDYIEFIQPEAEVEVVVSNIWQRLSAAFVAFMVSFTKDYDSVGGKAGVDGEEAVTLQVWISRGKEWAEILKQLADEEFYTEKNISINMNILPSGQLNASASSVLLLALASGTAPDVCLGVASNLPVEYGMRDAIYPLTNFGEEFDEVKSRFLDGIMIPFYFKGDYYGLPETMDFQCLYYRKDILSEYNLEIPDTWTDVYTKILPVLNNNGMDFYYAGGYNPFLFQNGGTYFKNDDKESAWDSPEAVTGFKQWTDLYTIYDIPVTADFYTRFRSGQMPLGIGGIDVYTKLVSAAPEISGKWGVASIPGTMQADGEINRAAGGGTTACIILNDSDKHAESWEFLKWYTDADTQVSYANDIKSIIGPEAIWASANVEAFNDLPWDAELKDVIEEYQKWYQDAPNVVGGYIVARYLENARVAVVVNSEPYRPSLEKAVKEINRELELKNAEFERREKIEAEKAAQNNNE